MSALGKLELLIKDKTKDNIVLLNSKDMKKLGLSSDDIVWMRPEFNIASFPVIVKKSGDVPEGKIILNSATATKISLSENSRVVLIKRVEKLTKAGYVFIDVKVSTETAGSYSVIKDIAKSEDELKKLLNEHLLYTGLVITWKEKNAVLKIAHIEPDFGPATIYKFDKHETEIDLRRTNRDFHAILVIDTSDSMRTRDVALSDMDMTVPIFPEKLTDLKIAKKFSDEIQNSNGKIRRIDAAVLSILTFVNEDIIRKLVRKVGIVKFAEGSEVYNYSNGKEQYQWVDDKILTNAEMDVASAVSSFALDIWNSVVTAKEEHSTKDVLAALNAAMQLADEMNKEDGNEKKPVMILLLTDKKWTSGKKKGKTNVDIVPEPVKDTLNRSINVIGFGELIDSSTSENLLKYGNGVFTKFKSTFDLLEWYAFLPQLFRISIKPK